MTPNELVLTFGGLHVCVQFDKNRRRNATGRVSTDGHTHRHTRTDAKRFYYLSHAICYSYGADNYNHETRGLKHLNLFTANHKQDAVVNGRLCPGDATWRTGQNVRIVFDSGPYASLCENMTSFTKLPSDEDRTVVPANVHRTFGEIWTCDSSHMLATDKQTDRRVCGHRDRSISHSCRWGRRKYIRFT